MFAASTATKIFRCPGEQYDISRSVHLARLAAFYSKCRNCPQAPSADGSAAVPDPNCETPVLPPRHASLFAPEGVRGRYLNELNRATAAEIAGAMASCLWERGGPSVVVAHDERPSSPDIVTGVGQALRRMGCQVVDIGLATRPCLMFAIDHLKAAGGILVTGAGCDPGWSGLDFVSEGVPCSMPGELDHIAERFRQGYSRPSRRPGSQRTFQASIPYAAGLCKHFHALRPLKIALACPSHAVQDVFSRVFRQLACRLIPVETPTRQRAMGDPTDPDLVRVSRMICETQADLGVLIADDGEQCTCLDEQGRIVAPRLMAKVLIEVASLDFRAESVALYPAAWQPGQTAPVKIRAMSDDARQHQPPLFIGDPNRENMTRAMQRQQAVFGADEAGRFWFAESFPTCDALLTVVHLLQALSRSDSPLSRIIQDVGG